jgi:hypothetical protein
VRFPVWGWVAVIICVILLILILTHSLHFGVSADIWPNRKAA